MTLTLVTPEKKVLDSLPIKELLIPGETGQLGILPGHAPLVSTLGSGVLKYLLPGEENFRKIAVSWGYVEVQPEKVIVLAESAETKTELDREKARERLQDILQKQQDTSLSPEEIRSLQKKEQEQRTFLKLTE